MAQRRSDWLTQNHDEIYNKSNQTVNYLTDTVLARIGIAGAALTWYNAELRVKHKDFTTAYDDWLNPAERTPTKTTVMQTAEDAFVEVYRKFYTGYMRENPLVTDEDLQSCGFPKHPSGGRKPPKKPTTLVEVEVDTSKPGEITFHYHDAGSHGTAKPEGVHGAEFVYRVRPVGAPPPKDWTELTTSVFDTRTPLTVTFPGEQRSMIVDFASRWENTRGEKGPWNDIQWVIIP
jgi:hypothetical protein